MTKAKRRRAQKAIDAWGTFLRLLHATTEGDRTKETKARNELRRHGVKVHLSRKEWDKINED